MKAKRRSDLTTWALLLAAVLFALSPLLAFAQPTAYYKQFWASPDYNISRSTGQFAIGVIDAQAKAYRSIVSPARGYLIAGMAGGARVDMNGVGGTAVGLYGIAEGAGRGGGLQDEVVGVYGRADKNGVYWATGLHGECFGDMAGPDLGGSCIGANIELRGLGPRSTKIGMNIQPGAALRDVIGLQMQDLSEDGESSYRYAIKIPNLRVQVGDVDGDEFCMKFDRKTQRLEFWRACNRPHTQRVGYLNMNYGAPDTQLNRR